MHRIQSCVLSFQQHIMLCTPKNKKRKRNSRNNVISSFLILFCNHYKLWTVATTGHTACLTSYSFFGSEVSFFFLDEFIYKILRRMISHGFGFCRFFNFWSTEKKVGKLGNLVWSFCLSNNSISQNMSLGNLWKTNL